MNSLRLLVFFMLCTVSAAEADPYVAWAGGRPQDAIAALHERAKASDRWDAWCDLGLAAAAAGDQGHAAAWLLAAHRRAPDQETPRTALRLNGSALPPTWCDRLGPVAWAGTGVVGLVTMLLVGIALGWAITRRQHRGVALIVAVGGVILAFPGVLAVALDAHAPVAAVIRPSHLLDSTGNPLGEVPAGTIVQRDDREPWNGRIVITLSDGRRGLIAAGDVE